MAKKTLKPARKNEPAWRNRITRTGTAPAGEFVANVKNWRVHPKAQRDALKGVLAEVGWVTGVIVNKTTGAVVDGHARIEEALKLGDDTPVPFIEVELSEDEEAKILATFDPISAMAAADKEQLDALLRDVQTTDAAVMQMLDDLAKANGIDYGKEGASDADAEPQIDKADELQKKWKTARGQVWELGAHRLMCGDSLELMRGIKNKSVDAVVTDPPYGVDLDYDTYDDTEDNWTKLIDSFLPEALRVSKGSVIIPTSTIEGAAYLHNKKPLWRLCWYKGACVTRCPIGFKHWEIAFLFGNPPPQQIPDYFQVSASTVREQIKGHPCPKPLGWALWLVERLTQKNGVVLEPFSGSGTTIIACEQLGRKCRAMEISPAYVAVALQRWADATGKTPVLLSE